MQAERGRGELQAENGLGYADHRTGLGSVEASQEAGHGWGGSRVIMRKGQYGIASRLKGSSSACPSASQKDNPGRSGKDQAQERGQSLWSLKATQPSPGELGWSRTCAHLGSGADGSPKSNLTLGLELQTSNPNQEMFPEYLQILAERIQRIWSQS